MKRQRAKKIFNNPPADVQQKSGISGGKLVFWIVFAIGLSFAAYTNHAWEDFYITYRSSKNLATGQGLVFAPGQRIHAFTSPFNVLIPAAMSYLTGNRSDILVLWLFRLLSITALSGAAVLLYRIAKAQSMKPLATFVLIGLFATTPKIIDFSINGQETGLMMLFLAMTLHALMAPSRAPAVQMGLAWTGLLWTRPDGCVYIAVIVAAFFVFKAGPWGDRPRAALLKSCLVAGAIATVLYLPWVLWAWWYYGTPIPHTMIAKGLEYPMGLLSILERTLGFLIAFAQTTTLGVARALAPVNFFFGGWPDGIIDICGLLTWPVAWYWVLPFGHRQTRAVSFAFFLGNWYLCAVAPIAAEWYIPNVTIFATYVLAQIVQQVSNNLDLIDRGLNDEHKSKQVRRLFRGVAAAIPTFTAFLLLASAYQLRIQQREIEDETRTAVGVWLNEYAQSPKDTVFVEPLGYIGFFSQLKMLDYPGLSSPEVVAVRRKHPHGYMETIPAYQSIIRELLPDWLVLRPRETSVLDDKDLAHRYEMVKVFDASKRLEAHRFVPGIDYLKNDATYYVYKKVLE